MSLWWTFFTPFFTLWNWNTLIRCRKNNRANIQDKHQSQSSTWYLYFLFLSLIFPFSDTTRIRSVYLYHVVGSISPFLCPSLSILYPWSLSLNFTHRAKLPKVKMVVWVQQGWNEWQWCSWRTAELAALDIILHASLIDRLRRQLSQAAAPLPSFAPLASLGATEYAVYGDSCDAMVAFM